MLYTLITFIGLFVIATTAAVIYYVKAEEFRSDRDELQQRTDSLVSAEEYRSLGTIVGEKMRGQSYLGTMAEHVNRMLVLVKGGPVPTTSAEVKVAGTVTAVQDLLKQAGAYVTLPVIEPNKPADPNAAVAADPNAPKPGGVDPNRIALTTVMTDLLAAMKNTTDQKNALQQQLVDLRNRFDDAVADMQNTKNSLTAQVGAYRQEVDKIKTDYNDLRMLVQRNSDEQIKILMDRLDKSEASAKEFNADLLKTQAELNVAQNRLQDALKSVSAIKPAPDQEAPAYKPDGKIIVVDDAANVVRINLGADDRVYRGLTFSVYDKAAGIPRDGKPKAEVEVFAVDKKVCAARILSGDNKNPVSTEDLVANLIWDSAKENRFVITGEFDLDKNGTPDYDAIPRIEALIRKWGGAVDKDISASTDYVILGTEPQVPPQPTPEQLAVDPTLTEKRDAAQQRLDEYEQIRQRAQAFWIPIFSYERFLYFTGYANQINKPGAF
jgi:archaellum component FlaC